VHGTVVGVMAEFEDYTDQTRHNMTQNDSIITTESEQADFFPSYFICIPCCSAHKTAM
jgi:hypothetical protein